LKLVAGRPVGGGPGGGGGTAETSIHSVPSPKDSSRSSSRTILLGGSGGGGGGGPAASFWGGRLPYAATTQCSLIFFYFTHYFATASFWGGRLRAFALGIVVAAGHPGLLARVGGSDSELRETVDESEGVSQTGAVERRRSSLTAHEPGALKCWLTSFVCGFKFAIEVGLSEAQSSSKKKLRNRPLLYKKGLWTCACRECRGSESPCIPCIST
jgi:hypothetical protein